MIDLWDIFFTIIPMNFFWVWSYSNQLHILHLIAWLSQITFSQEIYYVSEIEYLGYMLTKDGIQPLQTQVQAVLDLQPQLPWNN